MNIIGLTINRVAKLWDSIRYGIIETIFSRVTPDGQVMQSILCQLLKEEMQCWCIYNDENKIYGHVLTFIGTEMGKKSLIIYSEHLFSRMPNIEAYREVIDKIESFAKSNGCHRVMGYSNDPNAISIAEKLGYSSDQRVLIKEVF